MSVIVLSLVSMVGFSARNVSAGPAAAFRSIPNVNITRLLGNQTEPAIAIDRADPRKLVVTSNIAFGNGLIHAWSTDGGVTWQGDIIGDGDPLGTACCDSTLAADEFGNIFLSYLDWRAMQVRVAYSTDGGASFGHVLGVTPPGYLPAGFPDVISGDQPSIAAGAGAVWVTWSGFHTQVQAAGAPVGGLGMVGRFGTPENAAGHGKGSLGDIVIGASGEVLVAYQDPTGGQGPATIYTDLDPDGLGPQGFSPDVEVATTNVGGFDYIPAQSVRGVDAETGLAWDQSGGPNDGLIYLVYTSEDPQGSNNMDVQLRRSGDDGATWSEPVRVNDDTGRGSQFLPRIALDQTTGAVAIAWYDCRNDRGDHGRGDTDGIRNDDVALYEAVSSDGGLSFQPNARVGAAVSNSEASQNQLDFGDYEGLAFYAGELHPVWADNSNSTGDNPDGHLHALDLYTAVIRP
jgi:hypothetical protein